MRELRAIALALLLVCSLFATPVAASATVSHACPDHALVTEAEAGNLPDEAGVYLVVCDATGAAVPFAPVVATTAGNYSAAAQLFLTDEDGVAVLPVASENVSLDLFAFTPTGARASASDIAQLSTNETAVIGLALGQSGATLALTDPLGAYVLPTDAEPGELVSVRTVVLSPAAETRMSIGDRYAATDPVDIDLHRIIVGGGNATVVLELDADDGVDVAIEDVEAGAVITLLTNVTVPAEATVGESVSVSGMVNTTDGDSLVPAGSFLVVAPPAPPAPAPTPTPTPSPSPNPSPAPAPAPSAGPSTGGSSGGSTGSAGGSGGSSSGGAPPAPEPAPAVVDPSSAVTLANGQAFGEVRDLDGAFAVPVDYTVNGVGVESMTVTSADADFEFDLRFADRPNAGTAPLLVGEHVPLAYLIGSHTSTGFEAATLTITVDAALVSDPETLRVSRYDGGWTTLDATFVGESGGLLTYTVETADLGTFAISAPGARPYAIAGVAKPAVDGSSDYTLYLSVGYDGRASGALDLVLTVNGEPTDLQRVELVPGETKTVLFTVETDGPGVYDLAVNGRAVDSFVVAADGGDEPAGAVTPTPEPIDTETPAEDVPAGGSFPTAAVVGGLLIVVAAGAFLVLRR